MITLCATKIVIKKFYFFFAKYKMIGKNINFGNKKKNQKSDFIKNKKVTKIDGIDANKILVSKKEPHSTKNSFKYFIGYYDNDVIRSLCIKLPQMTGYVRKFKGNTTMTFKISNKKLLKIVKSNMEKSWKFIKSGIWQLTCFMMIMINT